jgi:hypothetical protein
MKFLLVIVFTTFGSREVNRDTSKVFASLGACQNYIINHQLGTGFIVSTHPPVYQMPARCEKAP